ncbi:MAG: UDP-2,4-diacetamido-2,4,6-trideoxy-beta-L-altropyranose hydrolase [Coleofasciculus chthonoplastes F3-SA18-01]|uniref:UDP-2,4-diacetamido-2,4, 6-trideoxy-beta-L-altropyranose hydrolase n=1 Tax=Coleofasciculus chthonoplastes TaxID=64178 RepID=UPI0032F701C4
MKLVVRVEASIQIGTGHVMRCLALAQAWRDAGGQPIFVMSTDAPPIKSRLESEGVEVINLSVQVGSAKDAKETATLAQHLGASWVVVDGYYFGAEYQRIIKNSGLRLLFIDDYGHAQHYWADIVLNQNIDAHEGLYLNRSPDTKLLLGTRYALLRREFRQWQGWTRKISQVAQKVLVTLGGSDPENVTLKVIQGLQRVDVQGLEEIVVVGGSNPHYEQLQAAVKVSPFPISLERNVTNMPELMAWADVAISAGGSTTWELAFMGLPSLVLILADNQRAIAETLGEMGVAVNLGWHENVLAAEIAQAIKRLLISSGIRAEMARHGQELIDGEGTARVLMHLQDQPLRLRPLRQEDCKLLWEWANDPEVRTSAFLSDSIPWQKHIEWFTHKFPDRNCHIFIALDHQDTPIGQVRFDAKNDEQVEIDVSIEQGKRRSGYGSLLIDMAVKTLFCHTSIKVIHAFIKPDNEASIRAFEKAQFQRLDLEKVKGNLALHYLRMRGNGK